MLSFAFQTDKDMFIKDTHGSEEFAPKSISNSNRLELEFSLKFS